MVCLVAGKKVAKGKRSYLPPRPYSSSFFFFSVLDLYFFPVFFKELVTKLFNYIAALL